MSEQLGEFVAEVAARVARETARQLVAGLAMYGVAASTPTTDPDGSTRQVVDVAVGGQTWPAVPVRTGETVANGNQVLVLMLGQSSPSGWLVLRA